MCDKNHYHPEGNHDHFKKSNQEQDKIIDWLNEAKKLSDEADALGGDCQTKFLYNHLAETKEELEPRYHCVKQ